MAELKQAAEMMPKQKPGKKAGKKSAKKQLETYTDQIREQVSFQIQSMHEILENQEVTAFSKKQLGEIRRNVYAELNNEDRKQRVDAALKRRENAMKVYEAFRNGNVGSL